MSWKFGATLATMQGVEMQEMSVVRLLRLLRLLKLVRAVPKLQKLLIGLFKSMTSMFYVCHCPCLIFCCIQSFPGLCAIAAALLRVQYYGNLFIFSQ